MKRIAVIFLALVLILIPIVGLRCDSNEGGDFAAIRGVIQSMYDEYNKENYTQVLTYCTNYKDENEQISQMTNIKGHTGNVTISDLYIEDMGITGSTARAVVVVLIVEYGDTGEIIEITDEITEIINLVTVNGSWKVDMGAYPFPSEFNLQLATDKTPDSPVTVIYENFAEMVFEKSGGRIKIKLFTSQTDPYIFQSVSDGYTQIVCCPPDSYYNQMPQTATALSYVWSFDMGEITAARKALVKEFAPAVTEAAANNIMHLMWIPEGYMEFYFDRPVAELTNIKGLNVFSPGEPFSVILKDMEARPVLKDWPEIYMAARNGFIDGAVLPLELYLNLIIDAALPYVVISEIFPITVSTYMNKDAFNASPEELQEIVLEAATEAESAAFQAFEAWYAEVLADMEADPDINVYYLTEAQQKDWWDNAINPALQSWVEDSLGDDLATA